MNRLLYWIAGRLPCRIIADEGRKYLERYYLCTVFGVRFYLHRFVGSDPDRGLHDHPWRWACSLILHGWYLEQNRYGEKRVRWFNWLTGESFHRVVLPGHYADEPQPCWTLFFHRANDVKAWGFWRDQDGGTWTHADGRKVVAHPSAKWVSHGALIESVSGEWWKRVPAGRFEARRAPL